MNDDRSQFENAPTHEAIRKATDAKDAEQAKRPGRAGAPSRFRLAHGHLCDFILAEYRLDPEATLAGAADAYESNFSNAIVNLSMNTRRPEATAIEFLQALAASVRRELDRLKRGDLQDAGFVALEEDGRVSDYDVRQDLPKKEG